jgi:uncharacterized membrane protein YsdA (DUF1294 family)
LSTAVTTPPLLPLNSACLLAISLGSALVVSLSVFMLALYANDKAAARSGRWRVSDKTLLLLAMAGGWSGALVGQRLFNHKRARGPYRVKLRVAAASDAALWLGLMAALGLVTFEHARWLCAQCALYVQSHPAEVLSTVTGIAGAFVMSLNNRCSRLAWPIWIVLNVA